MAVDGGVEDELFKQVGGFVESAFAAFGGVHLRYPDAFDDAVGKLRVEGVTAYDVDDIRGLGGPVADRCGLGFGRFRL